MQKYINAVAATNAAAGTAGQPVAGALVQVNVQGGGAASIFSDNGVTPATNPLTTDTNGSFSFYAADGRYQLVISGANIQTTTLNDILLVDVLPADLSTTLPASSGKLWNDGGVISVS